MKPKIVFFGGADYGKSTIIGYLYAKSHNINMDIIEKKIIEEVGAKYKPDYLFPYLVNSHAIKSIKDDKYGRASSTAHEILNFSVDVFGESIDFTLIDTPGHEKFVSELQRGMYISDIGVFCIAIDKVISEDADIADIMRLSELYSQYHPNSKLIYLLTMYDLVKYDEGVYKEVCGKIKENCRYIRVPSQESSLFGDLNVCNIESDIAAIIPVAVDFKSKEKGSANIFALSEKTLWYKGETLINALQNLTRDLNTSSYR